MAQKLEMHIEKEVASNVERMIHCLSTITYLSFNINANQQNNKKT